MRYLIENRTDTTMAIENYIVIIEALEKQIPYKITNKSVTPFLSDVYEGDCKCGTRLLEGGKYCSECGQRIEWD